MSLKTAEPITANDRWITNDDGAVVGLRPARGERAEAQWARLNAAGDLLDPDGAVIALSEAVAVQTLTATGTAFTGACEFRGIVVRAISGTPQTVTVYDATSATGTPIATFTIAALGAYYWDGDQVTAGNGNGGRRINSTGCHVVISGGTSRTIDVMVE